MFRLRMIRYLSLTTSLFVCLCCKPAYSMDEQVPIENTKKTAKTVIQAPVRPLFSREKAEQIINNCKSFEEKYALGLQFRDGGIKDFEKDKPETLQMALKCFRDYAQAGNVNAIHNTAMILYKQKRFNLAYMWFQRAAEKRFEPSRKNMAQMDKDQLLTRKQKYIPLPS